MLSLTTADIPLLRATLTIEEVLLLLPPNPGLFGAARMAGKRPTLHEEALWGLLPALSALEDTLPLRTVHATYIDTRVAKLAHRYFRDISIDGCEALADSLYEISVGARKELTETALAAAITATLEKDTHLRDVAQATLAAVNYRKPLPSKRGAFIELVNLRRLFIYTQEASEEDAYIRIVREMVAL